MTLFMRKIIADTRKDVDVKVRVIELIGAHFSLTEDDGEYLNTSPAEVYKLVRLWLSESFYERLDYVISLMIDDFNESKFYERGFSGWELMGGMESGWSSHFKIQDRGFIEYILTPAFNDAYELDKNRFWSYMKENILTQLAKEVSSAKPDFLSRAAIPVIIDEYLYGEKSAEAFRFLKNFLQLRKGIPDRSRLIFQSLRELGNTEDDKRWKLAKVFMDMSETKLPPNVFVEDVVLQLATIGNNEAIEYVGVWMSNPTYIDTKNRWHFYADAVIGKLLSSGNVTAQKSGLESLKIYLTPAGKWEDGDNTRTWDIAPLLVKALILDRDEVAGMLFDLYRGQKVLTKNRQLVVTSLLSENEVNSNDDVWFLYTQVVRPIIFDHLKGDIVKITHKFSNHHAREAFLKFAEKLIEMGKLEEGMELVRIFINDPNPILLNEPDDPDGSFNYHRQIIKGDDAIVISTVRGWIPFVLQKMVKVAGAKYLTEVIDINERLLKDDNYYVRFQGLILLSGLAKNRHTVVPPGMKRRFMSLGNAKRIEKLAFDFLEDKENRELKPLMERVLYCFNFLRSINERNAKRLLLSARDLDFSGDIDHLSSLYLFFAEFRKGSFVDDATRTYLGQKLYDDLAKFDDRFFKQLLEDQMMNGSGEMRRHLAWQFWKLAKENLDADDYTRMFNISHHYLSYLTSKYDHGAYEMLFHFIDDNMNQRPTECLGLWKRAIVAEKEYLIQHEASLVYHHDWWDRLNTAETALMIREVEGDTEFLKYIDVLLHYPGKFQAIHNARLILVALKNIESNDASRLLELFNENYPHIYAQDRLGEEG